jgi:hydroxymethylglutaryl-CoA synthase
MRANEPVGIYGYGAYVPRYMIENRNIADVWGKQNTPIKSKSFPFIDEDSLTIAYEAARIAIDSSNAPRDKIRAVFVGSESKPYAVKPSGTVLVDALGLTNKTLSADFEFACKAGTEAIQAVAGLVSSGMIEMGLAIGTDTSQGRPGDELEYTAAAGGAAFIISRVSMGVVAEIEASHSYVTDTPDFWRRSGEKYPRHLYRFTGEPAYFHHIITSVNQFFEEYGYKPSDFKYAIFHQPNTKFPQRVALKLGFNKDQIMSGLLAPIIGNTYSGATLVGLANVLDEAEPDDLIFLGSFGSGAGSDSFVFRVTELIEERRARPPLRSFISRMVTRDYSTYARYRGKLVL